jgi:pimeloyl-ACP methyl ester carboxylesterase
MFRKRYVKIPFPIILIIGIYFLGPEPETPKFDRAFPVVPSDAAALEGYVNEKESSHKIKPDNEARIIWADSSKKKTEYAVIYLHGFTASQKEGDPVHRRFAQAFGCNLYLARLADHGVDTTETLLYFTADRFWETTKEALAIGKQLGEKVIIMSTSTGGTTALMLAAYYPDDVYGLINMSPNAGLKNPASFLLNNPWGLQIARMVFGGDYRVTTGTPGSEQFWNRKHRVEALTQLEELLEESMTKETFEQIKQPVLSLYYYRDEENQDTEVDVSRILKMNENLGTPPDQKKAVAMPAAEAHVLGNSESSKDVEGVYQAMEQFAVDVLKMNKN